MARLLASGTRMLFCFETDVNNGGQRRKNKAPTLDGEGEEGRETQREGFHLFHGVRLLPRRSILILN